MRKIWIPVLLLGATAPVVVAKVALDQEPVPGAVAVADKAADVFPVEPASVAVRQDTITESRRNAIVAASQRVAPAVVSVNTVRRQQVRQRFFDMYIGGGTRNVPGLGSGFIIREDGLVLTNEHVVRDANDIAVTLADGRDFAAEIVGIDPVTDLALLRLADARDLPVAPLGTSSNLIIGEWAIAIGNPFGFYLSNAEPTVTAGVISAVNRNLIPGTAGANQGLYLDMIQTDASINPGNSGGPLVNSLGQVIGVNSSILTEGGGSIGLGFAIPIDRARRIAAELLNNGRVRRAWLGAEVQPSQPNQFGRSHRVQLERVVPGSPADQAGLRAGMVVARVNGRPVYTPLDWESRILDAVVGQSLEVVVQDGDRERRFTLRPQDLPSVSAERVSALSDEFSLISVTAAIAAERNLQNEQGALIERLSDTARRVGLREGDVILEINRVSIRNASEAARILRELSGRRSTVRMTIERGGQYGTISFIIG